MCGRFFVVDETTEAIERLVREVKSGLTEVRRSGDIHPTECAAIIAAGESGMVAEIQRWGFPGFEKKKVLINARAETALERKTFRESVLYRRIVIPAAGFYEWNSQREKVTFTSVDASKEKHQPLFMAGFYNCFEGEERFMILTTEANASMREVHHRMPLVLEEEELEEWLFEDKQLERLLQKQPKALYKEMEYEQQRLF